MGIADIRKKYNVPAKAGLRVTYKKQAAYIIKANRYGNLSIYTIDKGTWWGNIHPLDAELIYGTSMFKQRGKPKTTLGFRS
jgi:hypothetical protein